MSAEEPAILPQGPVPPLEAGASATDKKRIHHTLRRDRCDYVVFTTLAMMFGTAYTIFTPQSEKEDQIWTTVSSK